ncbi:MAG: TauD/TfdA family dioxygenase [Pseudomonadales bacterium]
MYNTFQAQTLHYFSRPHSGLPKSPVEGFAAWRADDMRDESRWSYTLNAQERSEIDAAVLKASESNRNLHERQARDLPLQCLQPLIEQWREQLTSGLGVQRIRGIPIERWSAEQQQLFYWCFGQHLGVAGAQNRHDELLGHVKDDGSDVDDPTVRQYRTTSAIPFHCDAADVVGLLCLRTAKKGGDSRLVSSVTVFNEMQRRDPELAKLMFDDFPLDSHQEGGTFSLPIKPCRFHAGELRTFGHSHYFRTAQRYPHIKLTDRQREALAVYDEICDSPDLYIDMTLEPGDIQLVSNHTVLHSRTHYVDHEEEEQKRHLLRLWISLPQQDSFIERCLRFRERVGLIRSVLIERVRYGLKN